MKDLTLRVSLNMSAPLPGGRQVVIDMQFLDGFGQTSWSIDLPMPLSAEVDLQLPIVPGERISCERGRTLDGSRRTMKVSGLNETFWLIQGEGNRWLREADGENHIPLKG